MDGDCCELEGYLPVGIIGYGATASVHLAKQVRDGKMVSIKKVRDGEPNVDREIENFRKCNHPNICQLFDVVRTGGWVYITMEYVCGGPLSQWLLNGPASDSFAHHIFTQLISAIEYIHTEWRIVHRDLKLENIMLDDDRNVKLIDFGFSKELDEEVHKGTACGSPAYAAPEIIKREEYGFPVDIWAAGVILYVMVVGRLPFEDPNVPGLLQKIVREGLTFPENTKLDRDLVYLLVRMLEKDPSRRITIPEIKRNPWFNKIKSNGLICPANSLNGLQFGKRRFSTMETGPTVPVLGRAVDRRRKMTCPQMTPVCQPLVAAAGCTVLRANTFRASPIRPALLPCNILSNKHKMLAPVPLPLRV